MLQAVTQQNGEQISLAEPVPRSAFFPAQHEATGSRVGTFK